VATRFPKPAGWQSVILLALAAFLPGVVTLGFAAEAKPNDLIRFVKTKLFFLDATCEIALGNPVRTAT